MVSAAKTVVDLLAEALAARLGSLAAPAPPAATPPATEEYAFRHSLNHAGSSLRGEMNTEAVD